MHHFAAIVSSLCLTALLVSPARAQPLRGAVDPADVVIELEHEARGGCAGARCVWQYLVRMDATGIVRFEGRIPEAVVHTDQIDPAAALAVVNEILQSWWFAHTTNEPSGPRHLLPGDDGQLEVGGVGSSADGLFRTIRVQIGPFERQVSGEIRSLPQEIVQLAHRIDEVTGTARWVFIDEEELDARLRSGWSVSSEEGARLLQQAIDRDDIVIARRLIELGGDIGGPPTRRLPPLLSARSRAMVELLVQAGADPNARLIGGVAALTPLMSAARKDASVAEALLAAGARVDDLDNGRSALWHAACAGNWQVVTVLLRAGASARGAPDTDMISALACTREARQNEMNRRRTVRDRGRRTVDDFDRVIALLENAEQQGDR
jgi:hypothetical protein